MTELQELIESIVADTDGLSRIEESYPNVFIDRDQQATPDKLGEWAAYIASQREYIGAALSDANVVLDTVMEKLRLAEAVVEERRDTYLSENASSTFSQGLAAQERQARANLSVAELRMQLRPAQIAVAGLRSYVKQLESQHREWRANEFTLDRMIRITQLRLQMSEI